MMPPYTDPDAYPSTLFPGAATVQVYPGEWTERSWDNPPWQGVLRSTYKDVTTNLTYTCFLSAPKDFQ